MNIPAFNPSTEDLEKTTLTVRTNAAITTFKVRNSDRFQVGQRVLVGEMSRERSELLIIQSKTDTQIVMTTGSKFPHDVDDPIYALDYDQFKFFLSTTGINGTYSELPGSPVDIDVDNSNGKTIFTYDNPLDNYYFKIGLYDSVNDVDSELSGPIAATGYDRRQIGRALIDTARRGQDPDFMYMTIEDCLAVCNEVNDDLIVRAKKPYSFLKKSVKISIEEGDDEFPFPDDLWKIDHIDVNVSNPGSSWAFQPPKVSQTDMKYRRLINPMPSDDVYGVYYDDEANREGADDTHRKVEFYPAARTDRINAFTLYYYAYPDEFKTMGDFIQTPTNAVYKLALLRERYMMKADDDQKWAGKAQNYDQKYEAEMVKLRREVQIDAHAPKSMGPQVRRYRQ